MREAVRRLTRRKAQGIDHWSVEQLQRLPEEAWDSMAAILNRIEEVGEWPKALAGAKIVFLSKGEGNAVMGQRPIGILPMVYRLWARVRLHEAEEEGCAHPADFEHGGVKGRSAMEAVFDSALEAELHGGQGGYGRSLPPA